MAEPREAEVLLGNEMAPGKALEAGKNRLKKAAADQTLDRMILKGVSRRNF